MFVSVAECEEHKFHHHCITPNEVAYTCNCQSCCESELDHSRMVIIRWMYRQWEQTTHSRPDTGHVTLHSREVAECCTMLMRQTLVSHTTVAAPQALVVRTAAAAATTVRAH